MEIVICQLKFCSLVENCAVLSCGLTDNRTHNIYYGLLIMGIGEIIVSPYSSFVRSTRPKQLIITIDLPGLESANDIELDYDSSSLDLYCPTPPYRLQLTLPYKVKGDEGSAKFEKTKQRLVVTLSVLPMETTVVNIDMNNDNQKSNSQTDLEKTPQESVITIEACAKDQDDESLKSCEPEVHHSNNEKLLSVVSHDPMKCPAYTYHQTTNDVTFILHVPVVKETTLVKFFEPQQFTLAFTTREAIQYSFAVVFLEGCVLNVSKCSVDVSPDNLVVMVAKSDQCCTTWQHFKAGTSLIDMQEKQFLTDENVSKLCAVSDSHAHSNAELGVELPVNVTELSDDLITISVDQPRPLAHNEPAPPSCNEPCPSPSPCSETQPSSQDPSEPHPSTCSNHSPSHIQETVTNQQPLPLHEPSSKPPSQVTTNPKTHPLTGNPNPDNENTTITTTTIRDKPLIPSNQLLFELD